MSQPCVVTHMTPSHHRAGSRRATLALAGTALLTAALVPGLTQLPAGATTAPSAAPPAAVEDVVTWGDTPPGLTDLDARGDAKPTAAQEAAARSLDAVDLGWNQFGTPSSILPADGVLADASSADPVQAARTWLRDNAAVFGLTAAQADDLELVNNQEFAQSDARAVLFRQRFGDLTPALGSMVTVGVANGEIAFASSSITPTDATPPAASLSPVEGWLNAARDVGRSDIDVDAITSTVDDVTQGAGTQADSEPWTRLDVPGFAQEQQVRLRALAMADGEVRPVFEANVVDVDQGVAFAYTSMVDAVTGDVLHRQNQVEQSETTEGFEGSIDGNECGEQHPFELTDDKTRQVDVAMSAVNAANDAVIKLLDPDGNVLASADLLTSPETLQYTAPAPLPRGVYSVQICPFEGTPWLPPTEYGGLVSTSNEAGGSTSDGQYPAWRMFPANPTLNFSPDHTPKNQVTACWRILNRKFCTLASGSVAQPYGGAWDYSYESDSPTLTTEGNNARTREAWASPLTPGGGQAPVSPTREYRDRFTDAWNNSKCDPAELHPGGNDILFAVTNLFVGHNRMHNYSFGLGFTEQNYNMQQVNIENPGVARDGDPEIGNAQAGGVSGGGPTYLGRDNANQITLQDGVPGITNQYLFQPIAGAFYSPCADGDLDMSIIGHEYTHAISNRMVGGPDEGLTSDQGGALGESWSDQVAMEYQFGHGYRPGGNRFAVGNYATGNKSTGIRNYAMNKSPLNFSNVGYDSTGPQVHADGEIWSATNWTVRQSLVKRWNRKYPYTDQQRQLNCSQGTRRQGPFRPTVCPGNRRWIALVFDAFLLQQGATSFIDARNAMIAADRMRFEGRNKKALWDAFAQRGLGKRARTANADATTVKPSFASPTARNATVRFRTQGSGRIFVGDYEARSRPVADTAKKSKLDAVTKLVPGTYDMLYVSDKRGFKRFTLTVAAGQSKALRVRNPVNLAAKASGARVIDSSEGSLDAASLIDGTENTNWSGVNGDGTNVDKRSPFVSVDLAGKKARSVSRVNVSALLNPPEEGDDNQASGSRFTALRQFALERCVKSCGEENATWKRFYTSPANAFPAVTPRPTSPKLQMRSFDVPNVNARAIRLVAVENQCTGFKGYAGEQDNDPRNATDCKTASTRGTIVHAAELQVFG